MKTLANIYSDPELLAATEKERDDYYQMIKARADLFTKEAEECGLPMLPYVAGFFLSIPAKNPDAICDKLHEDNIFAVPLAAGVLPFAQYRLKRSPVWLQKYRLQCRL